MSIELSTVAGHGVPIDAAPEVRERVVAVGMHAYHRNAGYNAVVIASAALSALVGSRLVVSTDGAHTCSGLVAHALLAAGAVYDVDAAKVTPARLAIHFGAPPPPVHGPTGPVRPPRPGGTPCWARRSTPLRAG